MRKVIGIGETILDIIFCGEQPTAAVPGGSVFNGIVSLGRIGVPICFISETTTWAISSSTSCARTIFPQTMSMCSPTGSPPYHSLS